MWEKTYGRAGDDYPVLMEKLSDSSRWYVVIWNGRGEMQTPLMV